MAASAASTPSPRSHLPAGYPQPTDEWPLDDGAGNYAADTARGLAATPNAVGWHWSDDPGDRGAMSFNGSSGFLALPRSVASTSSERTLSIQFKTVSAGGVLLSDSDTTAGEATTAQPVMYIGTDGRLRAEFWTGTANPIVSVHQVDDGTWHTATLVGDDASQVQMLYLDGQLIRGQTGAMTALGPQTYIGAGNLRANHWPQASADPVAYFRGDVREVLFYDSALTTAQVGSAVVATAFPSDGAVYSSGAVWYSQKSTMTFVGGVLSINNADTGQTITSFGSPGHPKATLTLQASDGDLVIYPGAPAAGGQPLWTANVHSAADDSMILQQDGNLVIYSAGGDVLWAANTNH